MKVPKNDKWNKLAAIAEYVSADARAYVKVKSTFVDIIILAHEVVAAAVLTFCTSGGSSPLLVAVLTELAIGVAGIVTRELVMGDAYGSDDAIQDFGTALAVAMTVGAAEIKALGKIADSISGIGGKIVGAFSKGAADHGFKFGAKSLKLTEASIKKFGSQGILEVGQGVAGAAVATGVQTETWKDNKGLGTLASSVLKAIPQNIVSVGARKAIGGDLPGQSRITQGIKGGVAEVAAELTVNIDASSKNLLETGLGGATNISKPRGMKKQDGPNSSLESFRKSPEEYVSDPDSVGRKKAELAPDLLPQKFKKEDQDALEVKLRKALPDDLKSTKLSVDLALPSNEVRVCYKINKMGLLTDIHVKTGPKATIRDIELHARTIVLMKKYSGFTGRIRKMSNDYKAWRNGNKTHPLASMAWEANLELDKLPGIIEDRLNRLENISLSEKHRIALEGEIKNLEGQIEKYKLLENDITEGRGYVAMEATVINPKGDGTNCGYCSIAHELDARRNPGEAFRDAEKLYEKTMDNLGTQGISKMLLYPPERGQSQPPTPVQYEKLGKNIGEYTINRVANSFGLDVSERTNVMKDFNLTSGYAAERNRLKMTIERLLERAGVNSEDISDVVALMEGVIAPDHNRHPPKEDDLDLELADEIELNGQDIIIEDFIKKRVQVVREHFKKQRTFLVGSYIIGGPQTPGHFMNMQLYPDGRVIATDYQDGSDPANPEGKQYLGWEDIRQRLGGYPKLFLFIKK